MALAVCLLFDSRSDRLIRELWARLEEEGVGTLASHTHGSHHPHLSLAVLRTWALDDVRRVLDEVALPGPVTLACHGTLVFPRGRVALSPAVTSGLATQQERMASAFERAGADLHRHYRPGRWIPHVSIATRASSTQLPLVVKALTDVLPLEARAERSVLIDSSTGRLWPLP